jgi:hypothetical protein
MSSSSAQTAHPLTERLIGSARERPFDGPVIEVGTGSGRNTRALVAAGIPNVSIPDATPYTQLPAARGSFGAALSTHAYLHGTTAKLRAGLAELRRVLRPGAPVYLTLGSIKDARYGLGVPLDDRSFAPGDGPEAGIPHVYLDHDGVLEMLFGFEVTSLEEVDVDEIVGRWAHPSASPEQAEDEEIAGRVHWFVEARRA